jgi:hypothetical protein
MAVRVPETSPPPIRFHKRWEFTSNEAIRTGPRDRDLRAGGCSNATFADGVASIPAGNLVGRRVFRHHQFRQCVEDHRGARGRRRLVVDFVTYQSAPPGTPKITAVLNNSSLIENGLPNSGSRRAACLSSAGPAWRTQALRCSNPARLRDFHWSLNGASITVVVLGVTTHPALSLLIRGVDLDMRLQV